MTNRRIDSGFPVGGTQPLGRSTSQPLMPPPAAHAEPKAKVEPKAQTDKSAVAGRAVELPKGESAVDAKRQELSDKKLQLTQLQLEMNSAKAEGEKKKAEAENLPLWKRALNGVSDFVGDRVNGIVNTLKDEVTGLADQIAKLEKEIEEAVDTGGNILSAGLKEYRESRTEGQSLIGSIKDAAGVSGKKLYDDVIDPYLDKSVLGADDVFQDQGAGKLGPVITNRLSIGESVSIKVEAGATIPLEEFGIPNAKIDAGGTLKISRMPKLDADGKVVTEPKDDKGNPPTELKVTLELEGRAGASYSANVGFDSTVKAGSYEAGIKAHAGAEAEAGATGRIAFSFAFDPNDSKDMGVLSGMMKMAGSAGAESAIPGVGTALAGQTVLQGKELIAEFGKHLYSVDGEGGLYTQATASASAQAGIFKGAGASDESDEASAPEGKKSFGKKIADAGTDFVKGKVQGKVDEVEGSILDQLQVQIGSLSASLGGEAKVGGSVNYRTGERTLSVQLDGKAEGSASVLGFGMGEGVGRNRTVSLTYNEDGSLKGVKLHEEMSKEKFEGIRTTVEDIFGRPIDNGVIAQISTTDTVRVSYELKPSEVAKVAKQMQEKGVVEGLGYATTRPIDKDTVMLKDRSVLAIKRTAAEFKAGFRLSLGAEVGMRAGVTLAHEQETVLTQ
ncbi:hypothetical protein D3C87_846990 [compost metagenome]